MNRGLVVLSVVLGLGVWSPAAAYCPFSSPISQAGLMEGSSGTLLLPDPAAAVGGFFWELGHGDPADGLGNDTASTLSGFPVPSDAAWIRRDLVPASIDWDWFFFGTDGCLSEGAGGGVVVAYVLDNAPAGPNYALLAVAGTSTPFPGHDFDGINTADGADGNFVSLQPLVLIPKVGQVTPVDASTVSVDVEAALASVNVHDDLGGSGPYPNLVDLSGVTSLLHRLPGGGDETLLAGCVQAGCTDVIMPAGRELCWEGSAVAVGHLLPGESTCEGGVLHGFACIPDYPEDGCLALGGTCITTPSIPVPMGPAIAGGCTGLDAPQDTDGDGFVAGADCDDSDPDVYPGAPDFCDAKNNDCQHPDWPSTSSAECFAITGLTVHHAGGQVSLDWIAPAGGADSYRVFRGDAADLAAHSNGGWLHASSAANTMQFPDELSMGELAFYVVAGVRAGIQGSLGQDSQGQERSTASP